MPSPNPSTNNTTTPFQNHGTLPIAIIGGGLGGLALAVGLIARNIHVHIYEAASAFSEIGAGVTSGVNAVSALNLIDPLLLEGYKKHATFNADPARASTFLNVRWGTDQRRAQGEDGGEGAKAGDRIWDLDDRWEFERAKRLGVKTRSSIHRARLLEELVALLPADVTSFGKSFVDAEELSDGTVRVRFADGTDVLASAVIGCDGIKSRVRKFVCGDDVRATYARECAYRAVVPRDDAVASLGEDGALNGHIYCGYGGYIITYPIERGDFINIVMMPHDDGPLSNSNNHVKTGNMAQDEWTVPVEKDEVLKRFQDWYAPLINVAARFLLPNKWLLFDLRHSSSYYKSRICLLGDAAHATTPHLGAGAGMAMEDAYILSSLIASVSGVNELERAFRAYDSVRRPRTQGCVKRSLNAALGYDFLLQGVGDNLGVLKERLEESFRWIWHVDLEKELEVARKLL